MKRIDKDQLCFYIKPDTIMTRHCWMCRSWCCNQADIPSWNTWAATDIEGAPRTSSNWPWFSKTKVLQTVTAYNAQISTTKGLSGFAPHVGEDISIAAGWTEQARGTDRSSNLLHLTWRDAFWKLRTKWATKKRIDGLSNFQALSCSIHSKSCLSQCSANPKRCWRHLRLFWTNGTPKNMVYPTLTTESIAGATRRRHS